MQQRALQVIVMTIITLLIAPLAQAHTGIHDTVGLADGFMHPVTGLDHLLVAIAAGFWSSRSGRHCLQVVMLFLILLLTGMLLGVTGLVFPQLELAAILIFVLPALVIAVAIARQELFAYVFFGSFAVYHGVVHMLEMPSAASVTGYAAGLLFSTGLLLALGVIIRQVIITRKSHHISRG
ncbi:MAG: HupE/UreJ family protein [Gammaproteobacteria bacterium]|jgi:urease accessory protein|nr:HupE/UreJ family protein [Gammaproteobacteria bacterium]